MKIWQGIVLSLAAIIVLTVTVPMFTNPLRRPRSMVTNYILNLTPIGMHIDDVVEIVESRDDWRVHYISYEWGFMHPRHGARDGWPTSRSGHPIIGEQSIRVHAGMYRAWYKLFFNTFVGVFWGFDEDGKLIEIFVWKSIDAL